MKRIYLLIAMTVIASTALFSQEVTEEKKVNPVQWNEKTHDFAEIPLRVPATATFTFQNISDDPVVITNVRSSCGCTVAKYTKEPVRPGEEGEVKATYNAARVGPFAKAVTVTFGNVERPVVLKIKGKVVEKVTDKESPEDTKE